MAGREILSAAVETPCRVASPTARPAGIGDHDFGVASADDGLDGRDPGVAAAVGDADRRAGEFVALVEVNHLSAVKYRGPHPTINLAGLPPLDQRFVRVGLPLVDGLGRRGGRLGGRGLVELLVGELVAQGLSDQAAHPGGDVDGFLRRPAPPRPAIAHARVSADELAAWQAKAAAAGVSLSELLRQAMARTQPWTAPAREVERERTRQIARIGSNLNQIARWAHTHVNDDLAVVEVLVHLVAIERDLAQLRVRGAGDAG